MPDATSLYLNRPLRSLDQFAAQQTALVAERRAVELLAALENLYWVIEENIAGETLWKMRHEMNAARDLIRKGKGL